MFWNILSRLSLLHLALLGQALLVFCEKTTLEPVKPRNVAEDGLTSYEVHMMEQKGDFARIAKTFTDMDDIHYFCYSGTPLSITKFWSSAALKLDLDSSDYQVYIGPNVTEVAHLHKTSHASWFYTQLPWKSKDLKINPFQKTCVGVKTSHAYSVHLQLKVINYPMLFLTISAMATFVMAPRLCRNQFFQFATGISAGILFLALLLTYMLQRKLKTPLMSWIGFFYSMSMYFITRTIYNFKEYLTKEYYSWIVGYIVSAGIISFAVVYRMGPPSNHRTLNLIQWTMQAASLVMIVLSSYHQTASLGLAILLFTWSSIPGYYKAKARTQFRKRFFHVTPKLLSEEEYIAQGNAETARALDELRKFCQSPESKPWRTVSKLQNVNRFADFIQGSSHITEEEVLEYSRWDVQGSDDEDFSDENRDSVTDEEMDEVAGDRSFDAQM